MQVIIIEDEVPAFNKLSKYLLEYAPTAKIIGWFRSIEEALEEKEQFQICDLILSDIKLMDGTSIELFGELDFSSPIIFCTAYNKYLQAAFDTNGIAYINKPYTQAAFNKAMLKYKEFFAQKKQLLLNLDALSIIENSLQRSIKGYKKRFSIKKRDGIIVKPIEEIIYFQACGEFCLLVDAEGNKHTINYKISKLETLVDTNDFFRINRSEIVNIHFIQKAETYFKNKMCVLLPNDTVLMTSGARTPEFRLWLDGK